MHQGLLWLFGLVVTRWSWST